MGSSAAFIRMIEDFGKLKFAVLWLVGEFNLRRVAGEGIQLWLKLDW